MDVKRLLNNLHEEVSCSVCMNTFTDPKQLPCLHSFCLHCLEGIQRASDRHDIITCPECRRESRVPSGSLNDLPTNFRINSLLDVLAITECNTTGVQCGNCDQKMYESFYCFQCCAFWCEANCISLHNGIKANKGHRVLALKDFQDKDFENVLKRPAFCPKKHHEKDELKFFCKDCEVAICNTCVVTLHEGHVKITLEEAANERKLRVKSVLDSQKQKAQLQRNKIAKLDESCTRIQEQAATVKREAEEFAEMMKGIIEAKKQQIIEDVKFHESDLLECVTVQKSKIEHQVKMTETAFEQTETLLQQSTSAEILQLEKSLNTILPVEVSQINESEVDFVLHDQLIFLENEAVTMKIDAEGIGSCKTFSSKTKVHHSSAEGKGITEVNVGFQSEFVLTTRNAEREQLYEEHDCVAFQLKNRHGRHCAMRKHVKDNKDGTYKISYFAKETGECEASVKVNGHNIRGSPFPIQVKTSLQFSPVLSFGQQGWAPGTLNKPFGVAVNERRNEIAVTDSDNNRIQVFSSDGNYLRSFGTKGDKQGEFDRPTGIAFDKNGNIIVVDMGNHRVQMFSEQGEYLSHFGGIGTLDHQFNYPFGLSLDRDGNIIVCDKDNHFVKIFSPKGKFLRKIGGHGIFTRPFHCVQHDNYLLVSDHFENCIKVFNNNGKLLHAFGKEGNGDGEFDCPRCLSVTKAGQLVVCDRMNYRIQIFDMNGKFLGKFGTKGSKLGQFDGPISSAFLSDGRLAVTDVLNDRVQILDCNSLFQ